MLHAARLVEGKAGRRPGRLPHVEREWREKRRVYFSNNGFPSVVVTLASWAISFSTTPLGSGA
jgi:hypothetical protein